MGFLTRNLAMPSEAMKVWREDLPFYVGVDVVRSGQVVKVAATAAGLDLTLANGEVVSFDRAAHPTSILTLIEENLVVYKRDPDEAG